MSDLEYDRARMTDTPERHAGRLAFCLDRVRLAVGEERARLADDLRLAMDLACDATVEEAIAAEVRRVERIATGATPRCVRCLRAADGGLCRACRQEARDEADASERWSRR